MISIDEPLTKYSRSNLIDIQEKLIDFLLHSQLVNKEGEILSWLNHNKPGYIYPEIMGYYISLFSWLKENNNQQVSLTVDRLQEHIHLSGGIGRGDILYVFDTCIAISGLLAYESYSNTYINPNILARMTNFIYENLSNELIAFSYKNSKIIPSKWSTKFGASTLKTCISLIKIAEKYHDYKLHNLALELADKIVNRFFFEGAFFINEEENITYTHAHCYALEGLLFLTSKGYSQYLDILRAGADKLKEWQQKDGSIFNWYFPKNHPQKIYYKPIKVSDANAQSIRIWLAVDKQKYAPQIHQSFNYLLKLISPESGVFYTIEGHDINSWSTIFLVQAIQWYLFGLKSVDII
ncbi:hypothetical protein ACSYAD_27435 [Acaryochloris marina NIES-2412]|uniref:hypothetical protein n=1 Tax=Acaryochloris marina TaxID=155978 RepID=UPI00405A1EA3